MEKLPEETQLKLTKNQLQSIINLELEKEDGLNELFGMMINGLMFTERKLFLANNEDPSNKGNGYRQATRSGIGSKLTLTVPRDRLGVFKPVLLGLLNEQEEQVKNLCFELYGKGLKKRKIEHTKNKIYGRALTKRKIYRITTDIGKIEEK